MSGIASEPILGFSCPSGTILAPGAVIWGRLESASLAGDGLASITISGRSCLVDESLLCGRPLEPGESQCMNSLIGYRQVLCQAMAGLAGEEWLAVVGLVNRIDARIAPAMSHLAPARIASRRADPVRKKAREARKEEARAGGGGA